MNEYELAGATFASKLQHEQPGHAYRSAGMVCEAEVIAGVVCVAVELEHEHMVCWQVRLAVRSR